MGVVMAVKGAEGSGCNGRAGNEATSENPLQTTPHLKTVLSQLSTKFSMIITGLFS
jgi:hypothetical protein